MAQNDREVFREVKNAIKYGMVFPMDDAIKMSYQGKCYIIKDFYEPRDDEIYLLVDGEKIEQKKSSAKPRKIINSLSMLKPAKTWLEVTIKDYNDAIFDALGQSVEKTVKYKGLREKILIWSYLRHFSRNQ